MCDCFVESGFASIVRFVLFCVLCLSAKGRGVAFCVRGGDRETWWGMCNFDVVGGVLVMSCVSVWGW